MEHKHHHNETNYNKPFAIGIILNVTFIAVELFYGFVANSSALIADAGHNASDVLGLIFAWFAIWMASKKPNSRYSYGFKKSTILISLLNALLLFAAVIFIAWDAIGKFTNPEPIGGTQVMVVAAIGVIINTFTALLFIRGQKDDLNIKGAFLHMAADAGVSLGVVIAGLLIKITGALWFDPIMSFIIILVILWGTWSLFIESINLALDGVPRNVDYNKVKQSILEIEQVISIHDLHIWALSTNENVLSAHIVSNQTNNELLLNKIKTILSDNYNLHHVTIQIENEETNMTCNPC
ncbi:cation transporter [Carboxylicivirga mesophila]|uniref:Cation transporter n=1 Tax=Carboxylicivirga mesophila TaxID=1166478 RepID=A0ABS5KCB5_9BACT|nr:cation diffusion facilitator family transporter [Carboxylicivirga mesophila]MBS2212631.1 cation transporter [Carboxylicivirga mesophila]